MVALQPMSSGVSDQFPNPDGDDVGGAASSPHRETVWAGGGRRTGRRPAVTGLTYSTRSCGDRFREFRLDVPVGPARPQELETPPDWLLDGRRRAVDLDPSAHDPLHDGGNVILSIPDSSRKNHGQRERSKGQERGSNRSDVHGDLLDLFPANVE